ncbi:MAG: AI-2E family transporter [Eubacterium sp.]|nr:AI-2E family transporter [Eubacterium sp.]
MKKLDPKLKKYWYLGVTLFLAAVSVKIVVMLLSSFGGFGPVLSAINSALSPVYIGIIIAYLLSPLVNKADQYLFIPLMNKAVKKNEKKAKGIARGLSVTIVLILALVVVFSLIMMVVPEVINSISGLISSMPQYYRNIMDWGNKVFQSNPQAAKYFDDFTTSMYKNLLNWLENDLLPNSNMLLETLTNSVMGAVNIMVNFFIGIIISIYLMAGKENFCAQAKKLMYAVLPAKKVNTALEVLGETHTVFAKFISGKIIDSLLVGILTFIIMSIAGIPYTVLISVIIGVTNIIPFFGQYIGIIPSAILVFIASPIKGVLFLVLIIILMQVDGNILGPKILGDSIGLKSFWILFSILFFGSLFGLLGMVCAVPVFAVIYRMVSRWCNRRLEKKNIPTETVFFQKKIPVSDIGEKNEEK